MKPSTSTASRLVLSTESTTRGQVKVEYAVSTRRPTRIKKGVENAVYAYLQALRSLGRTTLNTVEVADALSLNMADVNRAVASLSKKGVKVLNG
jgi:hypothetical protein